MNYFDQPSGPDFRPFSNVYAKNGGNLRAFNPNYAPNVLSDSTKILAILPGSVPSAFGLYATESHVYDSKSNLIDFTYIGYTGVTGWREIPAYSVESNMTSVLELTNSYTSGSVPVDSNYFSVLTYNGIRQVLTDSINNFDHTVPGWPAGPCSKFVYNYDGSNNLTAVEWWGWNAGAWELTGTYKMTYYTGTNHLQTYEFASGTPSTPIYTDSLGYAAGVNFSTFSIEKNYSSLGISDFTVHTKHLNALNLPDTVDSYQFLTGNGNPSSKHTMSVFKYDAFRQPVSCNTYYDTTNSDPTYLSVRTRFYYEVFNYTGVANSVIRGDLFTVFPNPASDVVSITQPGFTSNTITSIDLVNAQGQKVSRKIINWQNATERFSIARLLPGAYWLYIRSEEGELLHAQQIIKL